MSAPTPVENQLEGVQPKPAAPAKRATEAMPADVVPQNGGSAPESVLSIASTPEITVTPSQTPNFTFTPTQTATLTPTPAKTLKPDKNAKKTPTPKGTQTPSPESIASLPQVTTIPNPAYGDKVIFRVMTKGPSKVRIRVYNRFFNQVKELRGEGNRFFDILWSIKKVSQGIYYYQTEITDTATGEAQMLKMQSFAVMKDEGPQDGD